ncbi:glycosyltransferase family 2 protein [Arachidicoccus terrestris]|uniref:glycosyltransferase family 2 protein n=1 Tax=Arachidicoccus terrestris TaxID=2875539 RepID=UPI001CC6B58B|nr:glycosyltransferase family 2 protein [Arachidicoccus terrestris]UAY56350.1 glycosyltransferase family 2 protein [Arachidicoccus terrestris]
MLSIIIINFNSTDLILNCLASIREQTTRIAYEIIIVDNSGDADGRQRVIQACPEVQWLDMGYNAGFARANNKGIRAAKGDAVLLLNPDTIILEQSLDHVYPLFIESDAAACGLQLLNEDRTPQIAGNFAMKGGLNYLLPLPYIGTFLKWIGNHLKVAKPNIGEATGIQEVDWINGAFLMVRSAVLTRSGLLDEDFFLYAEEAEWCSRLKKQGKMLIYGGYHILHLQGETANEAFASEGKGYYNLYDKKGRQLIISNFLRIRKQFGVGWFLVDTCMYTLTIPVFAAGLFLTNILKTKSPFRGFRHVGGFIKNVGALWAYAPRIIRNKPYFYKLL